MWISKYLCITSCSKYQEGIKELKQSITILRISKDNETIRPFYRCLKSRDCLLSFYNILSYYFVYNFWISGNRTRNPFKVTSFDDLL